jgi:tRNA(adenine34) deaminase
MSADNEQFMRECLILAGVAKERGDSPVGSILVRNGEIIARGIEGGKAHRDITYHAEIEAIREARALLNTSDLSDCVMYTTHEPCIMCAYVIRHARIPMIVMGLTTGDIGGASSAYPLLKDTGIKKWGTPPQLITGVLEEECRAL